MLIVIQEVWGGVWKFGISNNLPGDVDVVGHEPHSEAQSCALGC